MLQVARSATIDRLAPAECAALRGHFDAHHWVRLTSLLDPTFLHDVQNRIAHATFTERVHHGVVPPSIDLCMEPDSTCALLELVFNDPGVWDAVERISGCPPIARFAGFVYRLTPQSGHHHNWHDDLIDDRLVGLSVNLGAARYEGGILQFRNRAAGAVLGEAINIVAGDALLFRLHPELQHRATPVTRGVKTAFAGWFCAGDSYAARLRGSQELRRAGEGSQEIESSGDQEDRNTSRSSWSSRSSVTSRRQ